MLGVSVSWQFQSWDQTYNPGFRQAEAQIPSSGPTAGLGLALQQQASGSANSEKNKAAVPHYILYIVLHCPAPVMHILDTSPTVLVLIMNGPRTFIEVKVQSI